jgi:hypothetical protein
MKRTFLLVAALLLTTPALARSYGYRSHGYRSYSYRSHSSCYACSHRSSSARATFKRQTGYPHGRPGYVIDHIVPLKRGGADSPSNMQWQTKAAAKAKDRWE